MESLLIVDDEVIIADGLYHTLQEVFQDRLEVRRCYSCDEACAVLNRNRVDILLTDIEMPGASGLELHRMAARTLAMTRVIYLTGYSDFDYARRALKQRAFAYVLKSEGDKVIISTVERAVENLQEESARLMRQAGGGERICKAAAAAGVPCHARRTAARGIAACRHQGQRFSL